MSLFRKTTDFLSKASFEATINTSLRNNIFPFFCWLGDFTSIWNLSKRFYNHIVLSLLNYVNLCGAGPKLIHT